MIRGFAVSLACNVVLLGDAGPWAGLGVSAILGWYLWYSSSRLLPGLEERHREERLEGQKYVVQAIDELKELTRFQSVQIATEFRRGSSVERRTILIIEDSAVDAEILTRAIENTKTNNLHRYKIHTVMTMAEGLQFLSAAAAIVCDVMLPDSSSTEVAGLMVSLNGSIVGAVWSGVDLGERDLKALENYGVQFFSKKTDVPKLVEFLDSKLA